MALTPETPGREWRGTTPVYLIIALEAGGIEIDLDEQGWLTTYADWLRVKGMWVLADKLTKLPLLVLLVNEGEQPYYVARHVGIASGGSGEIVAFGLGKKRRDGHVDRMWLLPNGLVCSGDDVEGIALKMLRLRGG